MPAFENKSSTSTHITFENGWTVSVAWGTINYCDQGQTTAEVWAWDKDNNSHNEDVEGYMTPNEVLDYMMRIASK